MFYSGDMANGPTTVVEAVAAGKNAAREIDAYIFRRKGVPPLKKKLPATKSHEILPCRRLIPVELQTEFFAREILHRFYSPPLRLLTGIAR